MTQEKLLTEAKKVLENNWNGRLTIPSATLYPHMWSWDSCFIAIGNSYSNPRRAMQELEYLFDAQWKNGMIPHIVFTEGAKTYFPATDFYEITRSPNAPRHIGTSGMTQPPVHAIACYYIYQNLENKIEAKQFLKKVYPNLIKFHRYLMTDRDPERSGLVTLLHPWESGTDDSPIWDEPLSRINVQDLPKFTRLDLIAVDGAADTIPSDEEYNKFIYLIELMKKCDYDEEKMYENFPFKIKDVLFTSIFHAANKYLVKIADIIGENTDQHEIREWMSRTEQNFYKYFLPSDQVKLASSEESLFYDYDLVEKDWIRKKTVGSLIPIYAGLIKPEDVVNAFVSWTKHAHFCGKDGFCHVPTVSSSDLEESYFLKCTYWRGPVWINTNWMIWLGLLKYGYEADAERIRQGVFELAQNHGFREYYNPENGDGLGGKNFSWTAALVIDMIMNKGIGIPPD